MRYATSRNGRARASRQLLRELRRRVLIGDLQPGNPLPSIRDLVELRPEAGSFAVRRALKEVEREGWAARRAAGGKLWVIDDAVRRATEHAQHEPPPVFNIVFPLHIQIGTEHMIRGVGEGFSRAFGRCEIRHVPVDLSAGLARVEELLDQEKEIPAEVGYLLLGMPTALKVPFQERGTPCIVLGYVEPRVNLPCIYDDMIEKGYLAGRLLQGSRRVVALHWDDLVGAEPFIIDGFRRAARAVGAPNVRWEEFYVSCPSDLEACEAAISRLFEDLECPAGVIALRPEIALIALKVADRLGIRVPEELQLVGLHHCPLFRMTHPEITSIAVESPEEMGREAAALMLQSMARAPKVAPREVIQPVLIERGSTRSTAGRLAPQGEAALGVRRSRAG